MYLCPGSFVMIFFLSVMQGRRNRGSSRRHNNFAKKSACFWQVVVRFDIKFKELDIKSITCIGHHNECSTKRTKRKLFVDLDFKIKTKLFIKRLR